MQFICKTADFARALGIARRGVATRSTLPVLKMVLIEATAEGLQLSGTNLEVSIRCRIKADVAKDGAICLPADLLQKVVGGMGEHKLQGKADKAMKLGLTCGSHSASLSGIAADEFPALIIGEGDEITLAASDLQYLLKGVVYAVGDDISRPVLSGAHVAFGKDCVTMEATDGYRLARVTKRLDWQQTPTDMIVPRNSLIQLLHCLSGESVRVRPHARNGRIDFLMPDVDVVSQLIEGVFPDAQQLVPDPSRYASEICVQVDEFASVCKLALAFTEKGNHLIKITIREDSLRLWAGSSEYGHYYEADVPAAVQGKTGYEVAVNPLYLLDAMDAANCEKIDMAIIDHASPIVIRPTDYPDATHIVMPMYVHK